MLDRQQMRQLKIEPPDQAVYKEVLGNWDALAKPLDGMGEFEELFARIGAIRRDPALDISRKAVVVMCADNGIVEEKISQSGQDVTAKVAAAMEERPLARQLAERLDCPVAAGSLRSGCWEKIK